MTTGLAPVQLPSNGRALPAERGKLLATLGALEADYEVHVQAAKDAREELRKADVAFEAASRRAEAYRKDVNVVRAALAAQLTPLE